MKVAFPDNLILDTEDATNNGNHFTWARESVVYIYYPAQELGLVYEKDDSKILPIIYRRPKHEQTKLP